MLFSEVNRFKMGAEPFGLLCRHLGVEVSIMHRINNKTKKKMTGEWCKHPRSFFKRLGNKRLRRNSVNAEKMKNGSA